MKRSRVSYTRTRDRVRVAVLATLCLSLVAIDLSVAPHQTRAQTPIDARNLPAIPSEQPPQDQPSIPKGDHSNRPPATGDPSTFDPDQTTLVSRDERSNTWRDEDGIYWKRVYGDVVNTKDSSGNYQPVDTRVVAADGGDYKNASGPASITFEGQTGAGSLVSLAGADWSLGFGLHGASAGRSADTEGSSVHYRDVLPGADLSYEVSPSSLKESVVLKEAPPKGASVHLSFPLDLKGLEATSEAGGISFYGSKDNLAARIPPGVMSDSAGAEHPVALSLGTIDGKPAIELDADEGWLSDPERVYPLYLDPSINLGTSEDTFVSEGLPSTNFSGLNYGDVGFLNDIAKNHRTFMKFNLSSLAGQNIVSARFRTYFLLSAQSPQPRGYAVRRVLGSWSATTLKWSNQPSVSIIYEKNPSAAEGDWSNVDITSWVRSWVDGSWANHGLALDADEWNANRYKRVALAEYPDATKRPYLEVGYGTAAPHATAVAPANGSTQFTATPQLQVNPVTDADGDPVRYYFRVATGFDANSGQFVNSGWITTPTWDVPVGGLLDGGTYFWNVYTWDGTAVTNPGWVRFFTVDLGLGGQPAAPTDQIGPATVNLTNGNLLLGGSSLTYPAVGGGLGVSYTYNSLAPPRHGLKGEYFDDVNKDRVFNDTGGQVTRVDPMVDFSWDTDSPYPSIPKNNFLVRWTGQVTVPTTGTWNFGAASDDGVRVWIDNVLVLDRWFNQDQKHPYYGSPSTLLAGQKVAIRVEFYDDATKAGVTLAAKGPGIADDTIVPPDWLTPPDIGPLPDGWTLAEDGGGGLSYTRAEVTDAAVTLVSPDGYRSEYTRNGSGFIPPDGEHGVLVTDAATGKLVLHADDGLVYTFRADGALDAAQTTVDDLAPAAPQYTWSGDPVRLTSVTDPVSGRQVTLTYGGGSCPTPPTGFDALAPAGILCKIAYPDGRATNLFYSSAQLARVEDPGGAITDFAYAGGRLTKIRDSLAADAIAAAQRTDDDTTRMLIAYDAQGRVSSVELPAPTAGALRPKHTYVYGSGQTDVDVAGFAGVAGYDRRVVFDALRRVTQEKGPDGLTSSFEWDDFDLPLSATDPAGRKTTTIYDDNFLPTDSYGPAPSSWFGADRKPLASYASQVPHTQTAYDEGIKSLAATYWANKDLVGRPKCHDTGVGNAGGAIKRDWNNSAPSCLGQNDNWSALLTGDVVFPTAGTYTFTVDSSDGARLYIDDWPVIDGWTTPGRQTSSAITTTAANERHRIALEFYDSTGEADIELLWDPPTQSEQTVPGSNLSPRYGLPTTGITQDDQAGQLKASTAYAKPHTGLATAVTQDPAGLGLVTQAAYEPVGTGYSRRTSRTLPAGNTWTYTYYGATQTASQCGFSNVSQAGFLKTRTGPDPDGAGPQTPRVEEFAHDAAGRQAAFRINSEAWSCTSFDSRGRPTSQTNPAFGVEPARTVTFNHAVGGNPLVSAVTDPAGTITGTVDLLGRVTSYTDVWGNTTTSTYDQVGRPTQTSGPAGTQELTYDAGTGRPTSQKLDGGTIAVPTYSVSTGELSSVSYPSGAGNAGNGTSLSSIGRDSIGRVTGLTWLQAGGASLTTDQVTRSQAGRVIDQSIDATDPRPGGPNFLYDAAGRLTEAHVPDRTTTYAFAASGGCGALTTAGKNTNRTSMTVNGGAATTYCYDNADKLTSTTDTRYPTIAYDSRGNTTTLGPEQLTYDGADRHLTTTKGIDGVTYTRDATGRIVSRASTVTTAVAFRDAASADNGAAGASILTIPKPAAVAQGDLMLLHAAIRRPDVTFRASTTADNGPTGATSLTIPKPATVAQGDLMLLHVSLNGASANSVTPPPGFSLVRDTSNGVAVRGVVYQKIAGASEPASYTVGFSLPVQASGGIGAWLNVDAASPVESSSEATATASTSVIVPATTASQRGRLVGLFALQGTQVDPPAGMAERWEAAGVGFTSEGSDELRAADGSTGSRIATSPVAGNWVGHLIALRPADVTATPPAGFTLVRDAAVGGVRGVVYRKIAGASEPASYTVSLSLAAPASGGIGAWSNVDAVSPVQDSSQATATATSVTVPSISATGLGRVIGVFAHQGAGVTPPAEMTERWEVAVPDPVPALQTTSEGADESRTSTAPTGTRTASSPNSGAWVGFLVTLRPAVVSTVTRYGFSGGGDSPSFTLDAQNQVVERTIVLPGVVLTKRSGGDVWSYRNVHGDIIATANASGVKQGSTRHYDPYGEALGAVPDNSAGNFDYGWLGRHQRATETEAGMGTIEMGARQYVPGLGRFLEVDPVEGGCANEYAYVSGNPVTQFDINGMKCYAITYTLVHYSEPVRKLDYKVRRSGRYLLVFKIYDVGYNAGKFTATNLRTKQTRGAYAEGVHDVESVYMTARKNDVLRVKFEPFKVGLSEKFHFWVYRQDKHEVPCPGSYPSGDGVTLTIEV